MTFQLLLTITAILVGTIVLVSVLLFGREWFRAVQTARFWKLPGFLSSKATAAGSPTASFSSA